MKRQQGMVLVLVLWIVSLLTLMAGSYAFTIRREISVVSAIKNNAKLVALAEAGLNVAGAMLFYQKETDQWRGDGSIYSFQFQDAEIRIRIFSESGKVNINQADEALLLTTLKVTSDNESQQQEIVDAILDWRDKDKQVRINGAEEKQYRDAGLNYQPPNKDFQVLDELQLVLGMDESIYTKLEPLVTVYSKQKTVDFAVASKEVILAISPIDVSVVDDFIQQRQESNRLKEPAPAFPLLNSVQSKDNNEIYTVIAEARSLDKDKGGIRATIGKVAVKNKEEFRQKLFQILEWKTTLEEKDSLFTEDSEQFLVNIDAETK